MSTRKLASPSVVTMTQAAMRAKMAYSSMVSLVLRGEVAGRQVDGKWEVDSTSLDKYLKAKTT